MIKGAIQRPVTVSMFLLAISLFGYISLDRLALNLLPDISYPTLTIQTEYQDAAPEEVETLITRPVEEAVGVLPGLTRLSSVSRSGQSEVVLEFNWGSKMDLSSLEAREKLDVVQLPRDARRPVILRFDPSYDPIMRRLLATDTAGRDRELARILSAQGPQRDAFIQNLLNATRVTNALPALSSNAATGTNLLLNSLATPYRLESARR